MVTRPRLRSALTALALVLGALFAPGIGVLGSGATEAHAVTKLTHAQATSRFSSVRDHLVVLRRLLQPEQLPPARRSTSST